MTFLPGQSGNPAGRPKGTPNKRTLIGREFDRAGADVVKLLVEKAKEGDLRAIDIVLSRVEPPLRATTRRVEFEFDPDAPVSEQAKAVMREVSEGRIDPDTGRQLLDMLVAVQGLRDVDTFLAELRALRDSRKAIPGNVVTT